MSIAGVLSATGSWFLDVPKFLLVLGENEMKAICTMIGVVAVGLAVAGAVSADTVYLESFESGFSSGVLISNGGWTAVSWGNGSIPVGTGGALTNMQVQVLNTGSEGALYWAGHGLGSLAKLDSSTVTTLEWDAEYGGINSCFGLGSSHAISTYGGVAVNWISTSTGWGFDARWGTDNMDYYTTVSGGTTGLVKFRIVVDGQASTLAGYYDFGSGYTLAALYSVTGEQIQSLTSLEIQEDYRSYRTGIGVDNIALSTPEPSALALLATGMIGLLAYAWRKRK